jgi:hypothetical protein
MEKQEFHGFVFVTIIGATQSTLSRLCSSHPTPKLKTVFGTIQPALHRASQAKGQAMVMRRLIER